MKVGSHFRCGQPCRAEPGSVSRRLSRVVLLKEANIDWAFFFASASCRRRTMKKEISRFWQERKGVVTILE